MSKRSRIAAFAGALAVVALSTGSTLASSHREAPLISQDPVADNTDLYAFVSPDSPSTVTIIGNWIPMEEPAGGPNFAKFGDDVRYQFHVDNNGDGNDDVTFTFKFSSTVRNKNTFLYNTGPVTDINSGSLNVRQFYYVAMTKNGAPVTSSSILKSSIRVAPANIGPRSTPNYSALAAQAVTNVGGGIKVFAGPRDDPFFVDLGSIFDLGGLRPLNSLHILAPNTTAAGIDGLKGYNVHSIAIQVPISMLTSDHKATHAATERAATVGIWASSSRQSTKVFNTNGTQTVSGAWRQVSRIGNPLINEVVVPVGAKDYWNSQLPKNDSQFAAGGLKPELAHLINVLYPATADIQETNRTDLALVLLQGLPGFNSTGSRIQDYLRLNTAIPPCTADDPTDDIGDCRRLGAFYEDKADLSAFPNGRRLGDDVTDIEIRAIAEGYGAQLHTLFGVPNKSPNNTITDGVDKNDVSFSSSFPYAALPHQGYESLPHGQSAP